MPVMTCLFRGCGQSLHVPPNIAGPVVLPPCPTCGQVNVWPPTDPRNQKPGRPSIPPPAAPGAVTAAHVEKDCPGCRRPLRLPLAQAGKTAVCPRCRTKFAWNPGQEVTGQEVEGLDGRCSLYTADEETFSIILRRAQGSNSAFQFYEVEKGTGGIDRLAAGNNYDQITVQGRIDYKRARRPVPYEQLDFSGFRCPWCGDGNLAFCPCGAVLCQGGLDGDTIDCPACQTNRRRDEGPLHPDYLVKTRGASFTPQAPSIENSGRAAVTQERRRKELR